MADSLQIHVVGGRSSSREKELPLYRPAHEDENVFIPLEATVSVIKDLVRMHDGSPTFIRAPVAAGKTTLAKYLAEKHSDEFLMVPVVDTEESLIQDIIQASGIREKMQHPDFKNALQTLASNDKTLIFDEAHIVFSYPKLTYMLFKYPEQLPRHLKPPKILLFSAASEAKDSNGEISSTPAEIRKKYMWYPPMPDCRILSTNLGEAEVFLDPESVEFFMKICSGHRGIFMNAMAWVQQTQQKIQRNQQNIMDAWNIHESVARVKSSFTRSKQSDGGWETGLRQFLKKSRAIRVNGGFSTISNIPHAFVQMVFGGAKKKIDIGDNLRPLTISGFLVPERMNSSQEFVEYDWDDQNQLFGIANSLMAEYYCDIFTHLGYEREWTKKTPQSAADLMARALPFMSFATVVDNPLPMVESDVHLSQSTTELKSPLSKNELPFEDDYSKALAAILGEVGYAVSTPFNNLTGKADVVVTYDGSRTCALEAIMATRSLVSHVCLCFEISVL